MTRVQTVTHFPCNDGFTAAWLLNKKFPDAKQHHVNHGAKTPAGLTDSIVIFADFCYPLDQMRQIIVDNVRVLVFDHHLGALSVLETLKAEYPNTFDYVFINEKSGAGIVADYYDLTRDYLINAIEANDLWQADDDQKAFVEYVRSFPQTYQLLDDLYGLTATTPTLAIEAGRNIIRAKMQMVEQAMKFKRRATVHGYTFDYANVPFFLCSETGHALIGDNLVGVTWYQESDGRYKLSFRSKDGKSAMALAQLCGGNGHENAAGATVTKLPWT